ncbi:MAG: hypothetical protein KAH25_00220 [Bacteroidales bacterium]|nr:hypothetical protein [Bacteroidales bacterium]
MIRYIKNEDIDIQKWDDCIRNAVNSRVYAYSWYLNTVVSNWSALVLDDYKAVFPIALGKKIGVQYAYQPVFTQQLGLFTSLLMTPKLVESFIKELKRISPLIQINLNSYNKISSNIIKVTQKVNHELDLISSYDILKKSYSKNLKRNIKKAQKANLSISKNIKPEAVIHLFRENRGKEIPNLNDEDYQKLNRLAYKALKLNMAEIWGVYTSANSLCAAAIFMKNHHRIVFLFSATNSEAKKHSAMPFLIDAFIKEYSETQNTFDFEGSNDANLARFYKSFGSTLVHYPHVFHNDLAFPINFFWKLKRMFS